MRCKAMVMVKDQLRVCRDGKFRFKMHYDEKQCSRPAVVGDRCTQHSKMDWVPDYRFAQDDGDASTVKDCLTAASSPLLAGWLRRATSRTTAMPTSAHQFEVPRTCLELPISRRTNRITAFSPGSTTPLGWVIRVSCSARSWHHSCSS